MAEIGNGGGITELDLGITYIEVIPKESTLTTPFMSVLMLSEEEQTRLGDGYTYTLQTYLKVNTSETYVRNWYKSFRIGVFNNAIEANVHNITYVDDEGETQEITYDSTDYDNLTITDIYTNAEFWSTCPTEPNTYTNIECQFRYNKQYPLYILIVGDYSEASTIRGATATITYPEPEVIETQYYEAPTTNGIYPKPIDDLVLNDGSTSEISIPSLSTSDTIIFYNLPLHDDYGTDTDNAIRGFQINGKIEQNTDNLILYASLVNSKNQSKQRSIILDETTITENKTFHIGQAGDLWGFNTLDMTNLEDWEVHLTLSNMLMDETATCNFGDINLTLYHENIDHQNSKCCIEGEDLSYYGVFITDVDMPEGLKTDTSFLNIKGTDINDPYRQNIKEKTITISFEVGDNCSLEEATLSLRQLTKLLVNERDKYNKPIPKQIEFSHYPDVYWEYIMEETLESEIEISSYSCKAKLVVPAGTSYDKKTTHTNTTGYISGLAHIKPNIQFIPTASTITISETVSQQEFNMGYTDWNGKLVEIDCDNRIVWLMENEGDSNPVNITSYVDFNSDWFILFGEYNFTGTGCLVKSVDWQQRW